VKTSILGVTEDDDSLGLRTKVVTENGIVYLMGLLSRQEADAVTNATRQVGGVQRVVKLFEYTD
jgi:osmotically-inducible protein OsmY